VEGSLEHLVCMYNGVIPAGNAPRSPSSGQLQQGLSSTGDVFWKLIGPEGKHPASGPPPFSPGAPL